MKYGEAHICLVFLPFSLLAGKMSSRSSNSRSSSSSSPPPPPLNLCCRATPARRRTAALLLTPPSTGVEKSVERKGLNSGRFLFLCLLPIFFSFSRPVPFSSSRGQSLFLSLSLFRRGFLLRPESRAHRCSGKGEVKG